MRRANFCFGQAIGLFAHEASDDKIEKTIPLALLKIHALRLRDYRSVMPGLYLIQELRLKGRHPDYLHSLDHT
jgi:hypothetical protein